MMIMVIIVVWGLGPVGLGWVQGPQVHLALALAVRWVGFGWMKWTHGQLCVGCRYHYCSTGYCCTVYMMLLYC